MRGQNWSFTGRVLSCLASLFVKSLHITNCWRSCLWSTSGKLVPTLELCPTLQNPFICPRGLLYLACIVECNGDPFCVSIDWDLLKLFNKLFLADLNAWSWSKIPHPTNSLSCEEHAIPFFWTNLDMFFVSLARTRCSISVPTYPKRSSAKKGEKFQPRICMACFNGIQHSLNCCISLWSHTRLKWDVFCAMPSCRARSVTICVTLLGWVQHITTSVNSCRNHMLCPKRSTSVEGHHSCRKQISSILQQVKERDLVPVAIDTKRHDSHCGCVVFCMCNSFATRKRRNTQKKTHKRCMILFIPRPILRIPNE